MQGRKIYLSGGGANDQSQTGPDQTPPTLAMSPVHMGSMDGQPTVLQFATMHKNKNRAVHGCKLAGGP
jgi:hypothetical protein